jgi:PIN domain nuclease of toxin-antitoxin system
LQRGRIRIQQGFPQWVEEALRQVPVQEAPFTFPVAIMASRIELPQSDPEDMFLAATACAFDLTLVTADSKLLACSWLKTLPND